MIKILRISWFLCCLAPLRSRAQEHSLLVRDREEVIPIAGASISSTGGRVLGMTDSAGRFLLSGFKEPSVRVTAAGYLDRVAQLPATGGELLVSLTPDRQQMNEVVVTGTMKLVQRSVSPVPVEVYSPGFFRKNPSPSLFEALQMVNGVRPQLNCNVCNTGDIHINGLEGPYTLLLIDGMPIVSSLSTVYGLSGIPSSLVERVEVIKGPASSLYGSEAIGGLINVITKNPLKAPLLSIDVSATSWREMNTDLGLKYRAGPSATGLLGVNYFHYGLPVDRNKDGFTDVTLQSRISVFNKLTFQRADYREMALALRYVYEDRWGGQMNWTPAFRGTDSVYGESIYTSRFELIGNYALPVKEHLLLSYSFNRHIQRSVYGTRPFNAEQNVAFGQLTWDKKWKRHDALLGMTVRHTFYDDNTVATADTLAKTSIPERYTIPGIFIQDEWKPGARSSLLAGLRWDYHPVHGSIFTPRVAWKSDLGKNQTIRLNAGTGFRVVHVFTEDHAALTGARTVVFRNNLKPEKSINVNANCNRRFYSSSFWLTLDVSAWYTRFANRIQPDYSDPRYIAYDNLAGHAVSRGLSVNTDFGFTSSLRGNLGFTVMKSYSVTRQPDGTRIRVRPPLTENWSGTWLLSYSFIGGWSLDYTGNIYGPMLLPRASEHDPRPGESPVWTIQNIQVIRKINRRWEIFAGVKNLLNWTPAKNSAFLIARAEDPFNKKVLYDANGQAIATPENPYGLVFDTNYVYAPNQGRRMYLGFRLKLEDVY